MKKIYLTNLKNCRFYIGLFSIIFSLFPDSILLGQTTVTFPTTTTWTCPVGVTSVIVECWGGGGAGGGATVNSSAGGGGGGGSYVKNTAIAVTPGSVYTVTVGATVAGATGNGANGNPSWFGSTTTILAKGGNGGTGATTAISATGGTALTTGNVGATAPFSYYGGAGGTGGAGGASGGGGGSSAGTGANGNNAAGVTGGAAPTGGFAGVSGSTTNADGTDNTNIGGGGAGGHRTNNPAKAGGNGGPGQVKITYTQLTYIRSILSVTAASTAPWCPGETRNVQVTIKNTGTATWTDGTGGTPVINIGVKWNTNGLNWADYYVRVTAANLAPGATTTYTLPLTASNNTGSGYTTPLAAGINNLIFDVVYEGVSWFGDNGGGVGPNTPKFTSSAVTINALPAITGQSTPTQTRCQGIAASPMSVTATGAGLTYQWYSNATASNSGGTIVTGAISSSFTPPTTTVGTLYYYCVVSGTCSPAATSAVSGAIIINANPTVNVGAAIAAICQGGTTPALGGSFGGGATAAIWSDGGAGGTFANNTGSTPNTTTYTAAAGAPASVTLTLTTSGGSCGTAAAGKTLTVNPNPTVNAGGVIPAVCQGGTTAALGGSFGGGATAAIWNDGGAGGTFTNNGGLTPNTTTYTAAAGAPASVTLTLTTSGGSCGFVTDSKVLTVYQSVVILSDPGPPTQTVCAASNVTYTVGATGSGLTYQWQLNGSDISNGGRISGATTSTLTITGVTLADDGDYSVIVSGASPCASVPSGSAHLDVDQKITFTAQPLTPQTICQGDTYTIFATASGTVVTYQWFKGATSVGTGTFDGTSTYTLSISNVATTDAGSYRLLLDDGTGVGCTAANSNIAVLNINPTSVGGTVSSDATVCSGINGGTLTLTGKTGNVIRWESSTDNFVTVITPIANTTTSQGYTNLTQTTQYRAVVQSGICPADNSLSATITVNDLPTITPDPTAADVCFSTTAQTTQLAYSAVTNAPTTYSITWSGTFVAVTNAPLNPGQITINVPASAAPGTYTGTLTVKNANGCISNPGITFTVTVNPLPTITTAAAATDVCFGTSTQNSALTYSGTTFAPTNYTLTWNAAAIGAGLVNVGSTPLPASPVTIPVAANVAPATYTGTITVTNGNSCASTGRTFTLTVNPLPTITPAATAATVCFGATSSTLTYTATNAPNAYSIAWSATPANVFVNVTNATLPASPITIAVPAGTAAGTYTGTLTAKTTNGCVTTSGVNFTITVQPALNFGTVTSADETICNGGTPSPITLSTAPSGGSGTFTYQWYSKSGVGAACPAGISTSGWTSVGAANGGQTTTYNPPAGLATSITYALLVDPTGTPDCSVGTWANGCRKVTVQAAFSAGALTAGNQTICNGDDPANITFATAPSGGSGTYTYQWYYQDGLPTCPSGTSAAGWTLIAGATGNSYDPPAGLTNSRTYSVQVDATGTPDCSGPTWASTCRKVTVDPVVNYGTVASGNEAFCTPGNPSTIGFSTAPSGGAGTFSYQWYSQVGLGSCPTGTSTVGWNPISGATNNTYNPPAGLTTSTTYAVQVNPTGTPDCGGATWSNGCRQVTINPLPTITTAASAAPVCFSTAVQTTTLTYSATTNSPTTYSIVWSGTNPLVDVNNASLPASPITISVAANTAAGTYTGTITVKNANGCVSNGTTFTLTVNDLPSITTAPTADACFSTAIQTTPLTYSAVTNSPTTYSITWSSTPVNTFVPVTNAALPASPINISVPANTALGTYTGTITVKNANGCVSNPTTFTVTVKALPTGTFTASENSGTAPNDNIICAGDAVTFTAPPGNGSYTFYVDGVKVQGPNTNNLYSTSALTNLQQVTVDVANTLNCGKTFGPITITVNPLPSPTLAVTETSGTANDNIICPTASVTLSSPAVAGSTYSFIINGSSVVSGPSNTYATTAITTTSTVSVLVTNSNGCQGSSPTQTITVTPLPTGSLSASSNTICAGSSVTFTATAGAGNTYNFQVNGGSVQNTTANTYTTTALTNGQVVTVDVTNAGGCTAPFGPQQVMTVNPPPAGILGATENSGTPNDNSICSNTPVTFTFSNSTYSNYKFFVNGGAPVQNGASNVYVNSSLVNGDVVTVQVTTAGPTSCTATFTAPSITIVPSPAGTLGASPSNNVCENDNVLFTATGTSGGPFTNYNFQVNGSTVAAGAPNTFSTTLLTNGDVVTVDVTNSSGCITTFAPITMTVNPAPTGTLLIAESSGTPNDGTICAGTTVVFTAPNGFTNYNFILNGVSVQNSPILKTYTTSSLVDLDTVTVAITNGGGCVGILNKIGITVNPLPAVTAVAGGTTTVCVNSVTPAFTDATPGGTWSITNGTGSASITTGGIVTGLTAGSVTVVYTVDNGTCSNSATASLTVNPQPVVATIGGGAAAVCVNASTPAFTDATGGGVWSVTNGTGSATITTGGVVTGVTAGTVTVVYTFDNGTCSNTATQALTINALPVVAAIGGGSASVCVNSDTPPFTDTPAGGTWSVTNGTGTASITAGGVARGLTPGNVTINYSVTNASGCNTTVTTTLTVNALPVPTLSGPSPICLGSINNVYTTETGGGIHNYVWNVVNGTVTLGGTSTDNSVTVSWLNPGPKSINVNYTDANGCTGAASATVVNAPGSSPTISGSTTVCQNVPGNVYTTETGETDYTWTVNGGTITSGGTLLDNTATVTWTTTGAKSITVNYTNTAGCDAPTPTVYNVTVNPQPAAVTASGAGTFCGSTTIAAAGGAGGTIYFQGTTSGGTSTATPSTSQLISTSGTYYFNSRSASGCWGPEGSVTVTVNPLPAATTVSGGGAFCGTTTITAAGGAGGTIYFQGTTTGGTSTATPSTSEVITISGTYYFRSQSAAGCWGPEGSVNVTITGIPAAVTVTGAGTFCGNTIITATGGAGGTIYFQGTTTGGTSTATPSASQTVSTSGTYYFRSQSAAGCWGPEGSVTVTVNPAPAVVMVSGGGTFCGSTPITASGGAGGTIYFQGTTSNGTSTTSGGTPQTITISGTYYFRSQSALGCWGPQGSVTVTVNPRPTGALSGTTSICNGNSATLTITVAGSGTISGTLSDGSTFSGTAPTITKLVTPALTTTYTITALSDANCAAVAGGMTGSAIITVNGSTPITSVTAAPPGICLGNSSNLFIPASTSTLLSENFEGATSTFTLVNGTPFTNPARSQWIKETSTYTYFYNYVFGFPLSSQNFNSGSPHFMLTNSDDENAPGGVNNTNTSLVSPTISTVGYSALNFSYRTFYRRTASDVTVVEVSTNGGASWTIVQNLTPGGTIGTGTAFVPETVDLSAYINNASFQVRFRFTTNNQWWWAVDDINLTGTVAAGNYSWTASPAANSGLVASNATPSPSNANIVVTPTATGTFTYTATLTNASGCTSTKNATVTVSPVPVVTISANYCATPGKVRLTATSIPAATSYLWSTGATTSFIDVNTAGNFDVSVFAGGACPGTANIDVANELVINGDFAAGNTGFTSPPLGANQYQYVADDPMSITELRPEGLYGIGANPQNYHSNFWGSDHTTGSGNFMIINGFPNGNPQPIVWQETVNVLPNTTYYFSAWALSLNSSPPFASLQFNVNGAQVGTTAVLGPGVNNNNNGNIGSGSVWTQFYGTLTTGPATTTAVIAITDLQNATGGNDFGLDDISFSTLSTFVQLESAPGTDNQTICVNTPLTEIEYSVGNGNPGGPTVSGLPAGVTSVFSQDRLDIDGTPTVPGNYTYSITTTGCSPFTVTGTIKVQGQKITLSSGTASPNVCVNTPMANIVYTLSGTATGVTYTGLPAGVSGSATGTISGTPTAPGVFNYIAATTGTCKPDTARGTITVQVQTITLTSANDVQTVCISSPIANIQYTVGGTATGATVSGLPPGVSGAYAGGVFSISGSPASAAGSPYTYTVTTTGTCTAATITGTITVTPAATLTLTSGAGTNPQTACKGTAITNITYTVNGGIGAGVTGLPPGVNGAFSAGTFTISGTPTAAGVFNYTITTTGGCGSGTATGTITVNAQTVTLTSGSVSPSVCINAPMANIVYTIGGTATGATISGLPAGVSGLLAGTTFTISGTPTSPAGLYPYIITTSGGSCTQTTANGTITIQPAAVGGTLTSVSICSGATGGTLTLSGNSNNPVRWEYSTDGGTTWITIANTTISQTYPAGLTAPRLYRAVVGNGCGNVFSTIALVGIHNLWTGAISTDWNTPGNWSDNMLPSMSCPVVYIPATANKPILSAGTSAINDIQISGGAKLTVSGTGTLQIKGVITNSGIFDASDGKIELNGTSQSLSGSTFNNRMIKDLVVTSGGTGLTISNTLNDTLNITGSLTFGNGTAHLITNNNITFKSTASGTASIGVVASGNVITGDVIVERYIGAGPLHGKSWQLLAIPTSGPALVPGTDGQSIKDAWQEGALAITGTAGGDPHPGYGTMLTSNVANATNQTIPGFDALTTPGPSIKTYNSATDDYSGPLTTAIPIYNQKGYFVLVRGDRSRYTSTAPPNPTVLRTRGQLFTPAHLPPVTTVAANVFESVGNPYASAIDLHNLILSGGVKQFYTVWDPKLGGAYGLGAFQTLGQTGNPGDLNFYANPGGGSYGSVAHNFIQSGQAFLVQTNTTPLTGNSVRFDESAKVAGSDPLLLRPQSPGATKQTQLRASLNGFDAGGNTFLADGVLIQYNDTYSNSVDGLDARKMANTGENLAVKTGGKYLSIERRYTIVQQDTIFLNLTGMRVQQYQFAFEANNLDPALQGFLEDAYLHTRTPLSLSGSTVANFSIENVAGSYAPGRFRIVFAPSVALPVTFTSVKAYRQDKSINVEWRVENESNMKEYVVEKSPDGNQFTTLAIKAATANGGRSANYVTTDITPVEGYNYYRVKSVDINGKTAYTNIVKVLMGSLKQDITIYPNPITDGMIHLQFTNQPEGRYGIRLLNKLGQVIVSKQISHAEGSSTELIKWDFNLAHGMYQLEVTKPDGGVKDINVLY